MTERLSTLLQEDAAALDVPPPPVQDILGTGRRLRRRRRTVLAAGAVGLAATVTLAAVVTTRSGDTPQVVDPAALAGFERWGAVAVGRDVYVGDTHVAWDGNITAMYYTSAGVVVRSSGDYALIRADGVVSSIDVDIPDRVPGFEPDSTRFAYAAAAGDGGWDVVVHDAAGDEELARVRVEGSGYGGWEAPPAAIDGDLAWVHLEGHWTEVNWRTGEVREVPGTEDTYELANGSYAVQTGRYAGRRDGGWEVRAWSDGSLLGTAEVGRGWYAFFSPDGRYLRSFSQEGGADAGVPVVHEVATGRSRPVEDVGQDFGWTPDGDLLVVDGDELRVCEPIAATCRSRAFAGGAGPLRIGGNPYES